MILVNIEQKKHFEKSCFFRKPENVFGLTISAMKGNMIKE